jgi:hypothetical protein
MNHPHGQINADSTLLLFGTTHPGQVEIVNDAFALIKFFFEIFSFHISSCR